MNKTNISAEPMLPLLRARRGVLDAHLGDCHLRHVDQSVDFQVPERQPPWSRSLPGNRRIRTCRGTSSRSRQSPYASSRNACARSSSFRSIAHTALPCFNSSSVTVRPIPPSRPAAPVTSTGAAMLFRHAVLNFGVDHNSTITVTLGRGVGRDRRRATASWISALPGRSSSA